MSYKVLLTVNSSSCIKFQKDNSKNHQMNKICCFAFSALKVLFFDLILDLFLFQFLCFHRLVRRGEDLEGKPVVKHQNKFQVNSKRGQLLCLVQFIIYYQPETRSKWFKFVNAVTQALGCQGSIKVDSYPAKVFCNTNLH